MKSPPTARSTRPRSAARPAAKIVRRRRSRRRPIPPRAPVPDGLGRDHGGHGRRRRSEQVSARTSSRERASRGAEGRDLSHPARRPLGHALGSDRRLAVRSAGRAGRRAARRDRQGRQAVPHLRRARAGDAAGAGARRGRSRRCCATPSGRDHRRDQQSRETLRARHRARPREAPTTPTSATPARSRRWGAIRWRATAQPRAKSSSITRSGNTATPDETWSAWSKAYTAAQGEPITSPNARYLQWRAVLKSSQAGRRRDRC